MRFGRRYEEEARANIEEAIRLYLPQRDFTPRHRQASTGKQVIIDYHRGRTLPLGT